MEPNIVEIQPGQRWQAKLGKHAGVLVEVLKTTPVSVMYKTQRSPGAKNGSRRLTQPGRVKTIPIEMFTGIYMLLTKTSESINGRTRVPEIAAALDSAQVYEVDVPEVVSAPVLDMPVQPEPTSSKQCARCRLSKLLTDFWVDRSRLDGRVATCRQCYSEKRPAGCHLESFTEETREEIRRLKADGESFKELQRAYRLRTHVLKQILAGTPSTSATEAPAIIASAPAALAIQPEDVLEVRYEIRYTVTVVKEVVEIVEASDLVAAYWKAKEKNAIEVLGVTRL